MKEDTSAGIVFNKELVKRHPAATDSDHHNTSQDSDQTEKLGFSKLQEQICLIKLTCLNDQRLIMKIEQRRVS